jgi:hypothetical protein
VELLGGWILLIREQPIEIRLLGRGGPGEKQHIVHAHFRFDWALVELRRGETVQITGNDLGLMGNDRLGNTVRRRGRRILCDTANYNHERKKTGGLFSYRMERRWHFKSISALISLDSGKS